MKFFCVCYFFTLSCLLSTKAEAQVNLYPRHFGQVMLARQVLNPAMPNMERATNVTFSNQFYTGAYSKLNNLYFVGNINLNGKDSARYVSSIGLKFVNEREGEFVERPKYYASYSFRTRIYDSYWLGLGIDLGRSGYVFKGTDISTSGSDNNWDGNIGIVFHGPALCFGGSVNQLFNSVIRPKDLNFRWARFYSLYAEKTIVFGNSQLSLYTQNQFLPDRISMFDIGANLTLARVFYIGSNAWLGRSLSFVAGLKSISLDDHHFSLFMSYNAPASSRASTNIQSFEMSLYYQFR